MKVNGDQNYQVRFLVDNDLNFIIRLQKIVHKSCGQFNAPLLSTFALDDHPYGKEQNTNFSLNYPFNRLN